MILHLMRVAVVIITRHQHRTHDFVVVHRLVRPRRPRHARVASLAFR
jgi:hypothetical protein